MYISPGYAGITGSTDLMLLGRSQYTGYDASFGDEGGSPKTGLFTASIPLKGISSGLGVQVVTDEIGPDRYLNGALSYAYHINIGEGKLGIGVQGAVMRISKDGTKYRYNQSGDPSIFDGVVADTKFDAGAGLWYQDDRFHLGGGVTNLLESEYEFSGKRDGVDAKGNQTMARHYFLTSGYDLPVSDNVTITPTGILKYAETFQFEVGGRATFNERFWLGAGYRDGDAITGMAGISFLKENALRFGYAFDLTTFEKDGKAPTSHEIMLTYRLPQIISTPRPPIRTPRYSF
jgi:type IX secretion system PorP/SprF family membrane protein